MNRRLAMSVLLIVSAASVMRAADEPTSRPITPVEKTAKSGPVTAILKLDRDEVAIPATIGLKLIIEAERGVEVTLPNLDDVIRELAVDKVEKKHTVDPDGLYETDTITCQLDPLAAGKWTLSDIEIPYVDARPRMSGEAGKVEDKAVISGIMVTVTGSPADVKGAANLKGPWPMKLILWAAGVLAVLLAVAWWARRKRGPVKLLARKVAPPPPPVPAHIWAMAELNKLLAERLPENGRTQEFYYRINAIVRGYIERRFGFLAAEQTSEEFIVAVSRSGDLFDSQKQLLQQFTSACDPVKYARAMPSPEDIAWVVETARGFIQATTPLPQPLTTQNARAEAEVAA